MKLFHFEQRTPEWEIARKGVVTGTKAGAFYPKTRGTGMRAEFWNFLAEKIALKEHDQKPIDWGVNTENEARLKYVEITGNIASEIGLAKCDDNDEIGYSPDGVIYKGKKITKGLEIKCPSNEVYTQYLAEICFDIDYESESVEYLGNVHIGLDKVPDEKYQKQVLQSFVVNDDQKEFDFFVYNPTMTVNYILITIHRKDIEKEIKQQREHIEKGLRIINKMTQYLTPEF